MLNARQPFPDSDPRSVRQRIHQIEHRSQHIHDQLSRMKQKRLRRPSLEHAARELLGLEASAEPADGWRQTVCGRTGQTCFEHTHTGMSRWDRPSSEPSCPCCGCDGFECQPSMAVLQQMPEYEHVTRYATLQPLSIRFSQQECRDEFSDGSHILAMFDAVRESSACRALPIRVAQTPDGVYRTFDNQCLLVLQLLQASREVDQVPVVLCPHELLPHLVTPGHGIVVRASGQTLGFSDGTFHTLDSDMGR
eukprot:TRINITY_DN10056_c0_g1_i3.p1 TRINITY_DN10056_c0_g1~~TRINITY_DN10056_c0_g1_i3.p1  ORF type:complete len:250 (-),score=15.99 TRINITY_DN10056_c0_g1_i3:74-823(-)